MSIYIKSLAEYNHSDVYIEIGCGNGDTIKKALLAGYDKVIGIDNNPVCYEVCSCRYSDLLDQKVFLFCGDSLQKLQDALDLAFGPATIFMDDHSADVLEEISLILNISQGHIFMFDHLNSLSTYKMSFVSESSIVDELTDHGYEFVYEDGLIPRDIMVALPEQK